MKEKGRARSGNRSTDSTMVETPQGILTASGVWFTTTRSALEEFAGGVFEHEPLEKLVRRSEVWLRSAETLAVWLLPIVMLPVRPAVAASAVAAVYVIWKVLSPSIVSRAAERVFASIEFDWLQGAYYVGILSYFAALEQYPAVAVGLIGFVVIRWRILARIVQPLVQRAHRSLYGLPVPDQVLRAFLYRTAMAHHVPIPEIDRIERRIADVMRNGR